MSAKLSSTRKIIHSPFTSLAFLWGDNERKYIDDLFIFSTDKTECGINLLNFEFDLIEFEKDPLFYIQYCFLHLGRRDFPLFIHNAVVRYCSSNISYLFPNQK